MKVASLFEDDPKVPISQLYIKAFDEAFNKDVSIEYCKGNGELRK